MRRRWTVRLRGGEYHGAEGQLWGGFDPQPTCVAWSCNAICAGHLTFDASCPHIVLATAVAYRRTEVDEDSMVAVYEVGDVEPSDHADWWSEACAHA